MNNNLFIGIIVGVLLVFAIGAFFVASNKDNTVSAGVYDAFAQCVYDSGLRMYGSATCKFCAQQRAMFGDSIRFIREIECDPRNPFPQTELCIAKKITATPTWILEDANGNDVKRFAPGVLSLETIGETANCSLPAATPVDPVPLENTPQEQ